MELSGRPRDPSGALEGAFLEHFGAVFESYFGVSFSRAVVVVLLLLLLLLQLLLLEYLFRVRW